MRYSTYRSVEDKNSVLIEESWETFVQRLLTHTETPDKHGIGLFNCTMFGGSNRCMLACAIETHALILDFDNAIKLGHPEYEKGVKKRVAQPVTVEEVEAVLTGWEHVIVTSHSFTDAWPRFRVVMPVEPAVPIALWKPFAAATLEKLGLAYWIDSIDDIYLNPTQQYFWPSHAPGAPHAAIHNVGQRLQFVPDAVAAAQAASGGTLYQRKAGANIQPFKNDQIAAFWAAEFPYNPATSTGLYQTTDGTEWRAACPLHGGHNQKFYVNPGTGRWYCQSKCDPPNKGGDIYKFVMLKHGMSFPDAKEYVHSLIGAPDVDHAADQIATAIETSNLEDVPLLVDIIGKQPKAQQKKLVAQLVTTHQLDEETVKQQLTETKVVAFRGKGNAAAPPSPTEANEYGLLLSPERYQMTDTGIFQMRWVSQGQRGITLERVDPPLADRPIWPGAIGIDLATESHYLELCWVGSQGYRHVHWVPENLIRSRDALLKLDDAPISLESLVRVSSWLAYAKTCIGSPLRTLTTEVGWFGEEGDMRFVMPGDPSVQYIGPDMTKRGSVDGWAEGLRELLKYGEDAYRSLVVLGLCAASPLVRLARKRNPVVGLLAESGSGKNKIIEYGLSIWDAFDKYRIPADSTVKGMQDKAIESPDFPIFVDELQQLPKKDPILLESVFYWMGNGVRRMTSSKNQTAKGGERRYGVALFAAEHDIMRGLQQGAQNRVVALEGRPLPAHQDATILKIESATNHNAGVVGHALCDLFNDEYLQMLAEVESTAVDLAALCVLRGDDPYTISLASYGLQLLGRVTGLDVPHEEVLHWLLNELSVTRSTSRDNAEDAFLYVMEAIISMPWGSGLSNSKDICEDADGGIAWRLKQAMNPDKTPLEINPTHPKFVELLRRKNVKESIAAQWGRRGWLDMNGPNTKRARSTQANWHSPGARTFRITCEGLAKLGLNPDFTHMKEEV